MVACVLFLYGLYNSFISDKVMVKTAPLVVGAGILTTAIFILYTITQPSSSVFRFFQFNQTNHDRTHASMTYLNTKLAQEFRPETLKPESVAKKRFDNELSRISQNLKSGHTAEFEGEQPSIVYVNLDGGKGLSENAGLIDQTVHNGGSNMLLPGSVPDQMVQQDFHFMQVPTIPRDQNVYQRAHVLNAPMNVPIQNTASPPSEHLEEDQNQHEPQLQNVPLEQNTPIKDAPNPDDSIQQEWRVINSGAQLPGYQVGPHEAQLPHQALVQNTDHQAMPQVQYNGQSSGVWQAMKPSSSSQLADLVQHLPTIGGSS